MKKGTHLTEKQKFFLKLEQMQEQFNKTLLLQAESIVIPETAARTLADAVEAVRLQVATIVVLLAKLDENLQDYNRLGEDDKKVVPLRKIKPEEIDFQAGVFSSIPKKIFDAICETASNLRETFNLDVSDIVKGDSTLRRIDDPNMHALEKIYIDFNTLWQKAAQWADAVSVQHAHAVKDNRKHGQNDILSPQKTTQLMTDFNRDVARIRDFAKNLGEIEEGFEIIINPPPVPPGAKPN